MAPAAVVCADLASRRVLCVGGRARQVPDHRDVVERAGGRFDHVDGADPCCLPRLAAALVDADLVILQPGYVCQDACNVVEQHCARTGVRCVQLDKACALGFARTLAATVSATGDGARTVRHPTRQASPPAAAGNQGPRRSTQVGISLGVTTACYPPG